MIEYRNRIRERLFMAMGMIDDLIEQKLIKNQEGYDIVDEFIIEQALNLDNRHISVFGLLYQCHSVQEVRERLISVHPRI